MPKLIANAVLFQLGWFACVLGGDGPWLLAVLAIVAVHLLWVSSPGPSPPDSASSKRSF